MELRWSAAIGVSVLLLIGLWFGRDLFVAEHAPTFAPGAQPQRLVGSAIAIDGDTLEMGGQRIRLHGIDAPELAQSCTIDRRTYPCGREAAAALARMVQGRAISCERRGSDRERVVAVCSVDGRDVSRMLVEAGWAVDSRKYSGGAYAAAEAMARTARVGIWRGEFTKPWEWRAEQRPAR